MGGAVQYIEYGERGITYQTEVLRLVEPNDNGKYFATEIVTEFRASYFELMQQRLHIELWSCGGTLGFSLNEFVGYASIPLALIADGPFK